MCKCTHTDISIPVHTATLPVITADTGVIFAGHKALQALKGKSLKPKSSHHKNSHIGRKWQSFQSEEKSIKANLKFST